MCVALLPLDSKHVLGVNSPWIVFSLSDFSNSSHLEDTVKPATLNIGTLSECVWLILKSFGFLRSESLVIRP